MTLYLLFEQLEAGKLKLDTPAQGLGARRRAGADQARLAARQTIAVEDAIKGLITKSANDAAVSWSPRRSPATKTTSPS